MPDAAKRDARASAVVFFLRQPRVRWEVLARVPGRACLGRAFPGRPDEGSDMGLTFEDDFL